MQNVHIILPFSEVQVLDKQKQHSTSLLCTQLSPFDQLLLVDNHSYLQLVGNLR